jgi:site-specific recombinase XerD
MDTQNALIPVQNTLQAASGWTDSDTIREWLHGLSENTCIAYTTDIADFRVYVGKSLAYVSLSDVQAYQASLANLAEHPSPQNSRS